MPVGDTEVRPVGGWPGCLVMVLLSVVLSIGLTLAALVYFRR